MCVAREEHDAATVWAKAAEKLEDEGSVGDMDHLESLFVAILDGLCWPEQVSVVSVAYYTSE